MNSKVLHESQRNSIFASLHLRLFVSLYFKPIAVFQCFDVGPKIQLPSCVLSMACESDVSYKCGNATFMDVDMGGVGLRETQPPRKVYSIDEHFSTFGPVWYRHPQIYALLLDLFP